MKGTLGILKFHDQGSDSQNFDCSAFIFIVRACAHALGYQEPKQCIASALRASAMQCFGSIIYKIGQSVKMGEIDI